MNAPNADTNSKPTVISTFAGCGGSSLGYKMAGFKELLAVELDDHAVKIFGLNFPEVPIWQKDVSKLTGEQILNFCGIKKGELDVFDGSPPCQGFSTAGKRQVCDPRNDLVGHYIRLVGELSPKVFIMENVSGMVKGVMKGTFIEYVKQMKEMDYNVSCRLVNAKWLGVPQSRQWMICIGVRKDIGGPVFPELQKKVITVGECPFLDVGTILSGDDLERWNIIPPGGNFQSLPKRLLNGAAKFSNFHRKLHPNKPCYTIGKEEHFSSGRFYHWNEPRKVTDNELKWMQSFPIDFRFVGTSKEIHARIGNSVPPLMMKAIAETIKNKVLMS